MSGTRYRWSVLWVAFLTYLFDSYDLIALAIAMPVLLKVLGITLPEGGLLGSATMLGAMAGSVLFGLIAENHGRRFALVLAMVWGWASAWGWSTGSTPGPTGWPSSSRRGLRSVGSGGHAPP